MRKDITIHHDRKCLDIDCCLSVGCIQIHLLAITLISTNDRRENNRLSSLATTIFKDKDSWCNIITSFILCFQLIYFNNPVKVFKFNYTFEKLLKQKLRESFLHRENHQAHLFGYKTFPFTNFYTDGWDQTKDGYQLSSSWLVNITFGELSSTHDTFNDLTTFSANCVRIENRGMQSDRLLQLLQPN